MKKLIFTITICLFSLSLLSQSCLPEGLFFTTQEQIDNFQTDNPGCTEIEGRLNIEGDDITNLSGLNVLTSVWGRVDIIWNPNLTSLEGLDNLTSIGGDLQILSNHNLPNLTGLENLTSIGGALSISSNSLTSLTALSSLNYLGERLFLKVPITSLSAFANLTSIGGSVQLRELDIINLAGLDNLTSIGGFLLLYDNKTLSNINALSNLTNIGGYLRFSGNDALTSLEGIENIDANSITELYILGNDLLAKCEVESICEYLSIPNGHIEIYFNADGCKSKTEVEDACNALTVDEVNILNEIIISPNPFTTSTTIKYELKQAEKVTLTIYDYLGKQVYQTQASQPQGSQKLIWNAEGYADGVYYYRLQVGDKFANGKLEKVC